MARLFIGISLYYIVKYSNGVEALYRIPDYGRIRNAAAPTISARFRTSNPFRFDSLLDGRRTSLPWFVTRRVKNCSQDNSRKRSQATRNAKSRDHSILTTTISYNYPQIRWINYQMPEVSVNGLIVFLPNFGRNRKPIELENFRRERVEGY